MIIYCITNKITGDQYIGQTIRSIDDRWYEHCFYTQHNYLHPLWNSMRKYGKENFTVEVIDTATSVEELNQKEKYWIEKLDTLYPFGYNLTAGGKNFVRSEELKRKISETNKRLQLHPPSRKGGVSGMLGKKHSEETRRKMSECKKGKSNPNFGNHPSEESRRKMSESALRRYREGK